MTAVTKLYLRMFLYGMLVYAIVIGIFDLIEGNPIDPRILMKAAIWSAFFAIMIVTAHVSALREMGIRKFDDSILSVRQIKSLSSQLSKEALVEKIHHDTFFGRMKLRQFSDRVEMKSGISFYSFGEKITASFKESDLGDVILEISSRPSLKATMIDFGRNRRNVDRLARLITSKS